jgi:hypothetical protein
MGRMFLLKTNVFYRYALSGSFYLMVLISPISSFAQQKEKGILVEAVVVGKDTFPVLNLAPFYIEGKMDPETIKVLQKFYRLRNNVIKVLPYARLAGVKLREINEHRATLTKESDRKAYTKAEEKKLKKEFEGELKNLTISQGQILIKLIDRETGHTSYELVRELRGSLQAFFWQGLARVFGSNLKTEYDSVNTDKAIEAIIRSVDKEKQTPITK